MNEQIETAERLHAYVEAHSDCSNLTQQITAISRQVNGVDTTSPLFINDVEDAADALEAAGHRIAAGHLVQYGIRFPNGDTVWSQAPDALRLDEDGTIRAVAHAALSAKLYDDAPLVRLDNVVTHWGNGRDLADFIVQAEEIAAAARIDVAEYLRALRIVRRTIIVDTTETEVLEFLNDDEDDAGESPSS